ncbi:MAG: efflux RND transporter periplasmic adaptor subunit [Verrucomicrobiota bacterium]
MAKSSFQWAKWLVVIVVIAGVAVAWSYFRADHGSAPEYQTAAVERDTVVQGVTATGQLNPVVNVQVGSQVSGIILKLYADWNSPVKANQVVAELDPATYKAAVAQAQGELANAQANLELAQVEAKRTSDLFAAKLISESENDTKNAALHQAQAMVQIREAALANAKVNLSRCTIYSPVDGVVISRSVDVGQTVAASLSAPVLFQIANDLTKMQIDANVAEADVGGVEEGQNVNFTVDAFPYRTFHGKVVQVRNAPATVQNVVTYDTVIGVNNADLKLKPGMTANVSIVLAEHTDTLKIPNAALRFRMPEPAKNNGASATSPSPGTNSRSGSGYTGGARGAGAGGAGMRVHGKQNTRTVYVLENATAGEPAEPKPVQVKIGITDGIYTEVLEGLKEGDQVVTGSKVSQEENSKSSNPFSGGRIRHF